LSLSLSSLYFFSASVPTRPLPSFPTRRSSDLISVRDPACLLHRRWHFGGSPRGRRGLHSSQPGARCDGSRLDADRERHSGGCHLDRKSTRLNSSHEWISYAVFCLKKKQKNLYI